MMPFIYIIILAAFGLLVLGFYLKEWVLGTISAMLIMVIGVYTAANGIVGINNFLTQALAVIFIGLGAYVFIRGAIEKF